MRSATERAVCWPSGAPGRLWRWPLLWPGFESIMNRSQANILLVLVALIWGSAFVAQARGMDGVGPFTFTGLRFLGPVQDL